MGGPPWPPLLPEAKCLDGKRDGHGGPPIQECRESLSLMYVWTGERRADAFADNRRSRVLRVAPG